VERGGVLKKERMIRTSHRIPLERARLTYRLDPQLGQSKGVLGGKSAG